MSNIVVVDPTGVVCQERHWLEEAGVETMHVGSLDALHDVERSPSLRVALIDLELVEEHSWVMDELVKRLGLAVVVITSVPSVRGTVTAMRSGALDVFERPVRPRSLLSTVRAALSGVVTSQAYACSPPTTPVVHPAQRVGRALMPVIESDVDICTLDEWAHVAAASRGALRNWCVTAHVRPRRVLLFGRLLRATLLAPRQPVERILNERHRLGHSDSARSRDGQRHRRWIDRKNIVIAILQVEGVSANAAADVQNWRYTSADDLPFDGRPLLVRREVERHLTTAHHDIAVISLEQRGILFDDRLEVESRWLQLKGVVVVQHIHPQRIVG